MAVGPGASRGWAASLGIALSAFAAGSCVHQKPQLRGPMAVRSQHPAQLSVLALVPQSVGVDPGEVRTRFTNAYSSLFLAGGDNAGQSFEMDGEIWRSALGARIGLGAGFEVDFEIPVLHTTGGFLDSFVVDWHDTFGFANRGRDTFPQDQFNVRARNRGRIAFEQAESDLELADIPISLGWTFAEPRDDRPFGGAVRVGVELPTGDEERGFGNGGLDVALGVVGEYRGEWVGFGMHAEHTFATTPDPSRRAGLDFRDVTSAGLSIEFPVFDGWHAVAQIEWETSTLRQLGFPRAADDEWNLWTGVRVDVADRSQLEVSIGEDLAAFIAPDFTIWLTWLWAFGR